MKFDAAINAHHMISKQSAMWFLVVITLIGCSGKTSVSDLEKSFSTLVPITDMNNSLQLVVEGQKTSFEPAEKIRLIVYNKSSYSLSFDSDTHIRLLGSPDNLSWVEVKNATAYSGKLVVRPKGTALLDTRYTIVKPILDQSNFAMQNSEILLRIVIIGEIMKDDTSTGEKAAAFVDVELKP